MIPISQTRFEANGQNGNCMQAATASMLDLPLRLVPNFIESTDPNRDMDAFFRAVGYRLERRPLKSQPKGYYFATGVSTQGHQHIVICKAGELAHDPNPHGRGLVSVDGVFAVVPVKPAPSLKRQEVTIKAVQVSAAVDAWYRKKLQALVSDMAQSMLYHLKAAWKEAEPDIGFAADASPTLTLRRALKKWGDSQVDRFDSLADEVAKAFATLSRRDFDRRFASILKKAGFAIEFRPTEAMTEAYRAVVAENVALIKSIPQKFLTDVQSSVWRNVMKGGDMAALSKTIKHNYGVSWRRAAFISRDQNAKARAVFERARRSEIGITEAVWQHSRAGREPRPTHVRMSGKKFTVSKGMYDSAVQKWIQPGELPKCLCTSKSVFSGV